jgi:hypothetical protein
MRASTFLIGNRFSSLLVTLQFGLLLLQVTLAVPKVLQGAFSRDSWVTAAVSLALTAWTLRHNKLGNFNIRPIPKACGSLVTTGPYRWVRHPMYTSLSVIVDTDDARHEAGDLLQAGLNVGQFATLRDVVCNSLAGPKGPVLFKSCGWAG